MNLDYDYDYQREQVAQFQRWVAHMQDPRFIGLFGAEKCAAALATYQESLRKHTELMNRAKAYNEASPDGLA